MRVRGKAATPSGALVDVEFEISDDSPEAQQLREGMSFSIAPQPDPEPCINLYCGRDRPHDLSPECPIVP